MAFPESKFQPMAFYIPSEHVGGVPEVNYERWPDTGQPPQDVKEYVELYIRMTYPDYDNDAIERETALCLENQLLQEYFSTQMQLDEEQRKRDPQWTTFFYADAHQNKLS